MIFFPRPTNTLTLVTIFIFSVIVFVYGAKFIEKEIVKSMFFF